MTSFQNPLPAIPAAPSARTEITIDALAFHLSYLDTKLAAIGEEFAEDISAQPAHDLHSAWDEVQQARLALDRLCARMAADPPAA